MGGDAEEYLAAVVRACAASKLPVFKDGITNLLRFKQSMNLLRSTLLLLWRGSY